MFKKPLNASKPSTPLRSSERRGLAASIADDYGIDIETAKLLVPEGILAGKALTHTDVPCILYTSPSNGDVLWIKRDLRGNDALLYPSLYTLIHLPTLLPIIETAPMVIAKLSSGADLMRPGCSDRSLAALPELPAGSLVAISSVHEPNVPRAVGQLAMPTSQLRAEGKGKAVNLLHAYEDHVWNAGSREALPLDRPSGQEMAAADANVTQAEARPESVATTTATSAPIRMQFSSSDVDVILREALLLAIKRSLGKDPKAFPMPSSTVYSAHILPNRPANSSSDVDIKHTTLKKLTPFLKAAQKEGILQLKETKADVLVLSVNTEHPEVLAQKGYKTMADVARQAANADQPDSGPSAMQVVELYRPHGNNLPFWENEGKSYVPRKEDALTAGEVKSSIVGYITRHRLAYAADAKYVKPDGGLKAAIARKGEAAADLDALARHEVMERILEGMQRWHRLERPGNEPLMRKGPGPSIEVAVKQRQGKKVVTVITGLEPYLIDADELASTLQTLCASSTSVNPLPQSTPKKPMRECTVQGDQRKVVHGVLCDRLGVPKAYVTEVPLKRK